MPGEMHEAPSYEELADLVARQRQGILELNEFIERQEATIARLEEAATSGRRWKPNRKDTTDPTPKALGVRVEAILELSKREAEQIREDARRTATETIAAAEREAARIRAAAAGRESVPGSDADSV